MKELFASPSDHKQRCRARFDIVGLMGVGAALRIRVTNNTTCRLRAAVACAGFARGVTVHFSASNNSTTRKCVILCAVAIDVQTNCGGIARTSFVLEADRAIIANASPRDLQFER
jgi:hypothetical protein